MSYSCTTLLSLHHACSCHGAKGRLVEGGLVQGGLLLGGLQWHGERSYLRDPEPYTAQLFSGLPQTFQRVQAKGTETLRPLFG